MTDLMPIIFRAERSGDFKGDVTAVFPTITERAGFLTYAHIGQHSAGSLGWYRQTRAAKPAEYADLLRELRRIYEADGDCRLVVRQRMSRN